MEIFFSSLANLFGKNSHRRHIFSKTLSKAKIFENAGFSFCVDGQKQKFSKTMTSYIIKFYYYNNYYPCSVRGTILFSLFSISMWTGEDDSNILGVDTSIF